MEQIRAPSQSAWIWEKARGLGAKATEEQGLEGIRAPSQSARIWKKARGLGAKATEEQGVERIHAPSQSAWIWKKVGGGLVQRRRKNKGWSGFMHQVPVRGERKKPKEAFCACNPLSYIENYPGKCYTSTKFCKD